MIEWIFIKSILMIIKEGIVIIAAILCAIYIVRYFFNIGANNVSNNYKR